MKVSAIVCLTCKYTVFSRARHDFRRCQCGECFIDGGRDYTKVGGKILPMFTEIEVDATQEELYQDWNESTDKHGLLPPPEA